jgi:hypothetical protein
MREKKLKKNKISRTRAVELINENAGKFFTVVFTKNQGDGELRTINGVFKRNNTDRLGYLNVYENKSKTYRKVNPRTISSLSILKEVYKVK